jgi:hypothetical protein
MSDKSWMLNPTAIAQARSCITIIQEELGVKLKLSHPQFLEMIFDYIELTDSEELASAYQILSSLADGQMPTNAAAPAEKVTRIKPRITKTTTHDSPAVSNNNRLGEEVVEYKGRQYPKYADGGEFKGLYRGQPRYS